MSDNGSKLPSNQPVKMDGSSYKRLPTFRTPRDLKLTEFQKISTNTNDPKKKVYKPNLNVQRKKTFDQPVIKVTPDLKSNDKTPLSEKGKKGKKKQPNLIQGAGVFSEGLAPSMKTGRWNSRFSDASTPSMLERPKFKGTVKVDKEEEAKVMKELLRDDFIDDPSWIPDVRQCPVKLPLKNFGGDIFCKLEDGDAMKNNIVKVKVEEGVGDSETVSEPVVETVPRTIEEMVPLNINQLLAQQSESSFIFFQLPHSMPKEKTFVPTNSNSKQVSKSVAQSSNSTTPNPPAPEPEERSILKNLPEGKIGKLQLLKSGQARLVLGDAVFMVDPGTQPSFKQDVVALVDMVATSKTGNMVHIGNVSSRMIVSPDWEALLKDS